ncbi:MAG TPA: serine/threonine-protein kinase [Gemmatimonadaceae bacterium]|nr:serine/threonine-protein kinase [Gemmatimonadaceae bacterium]
MSSPSFVVQTDLDVVRAALDADYEVLEEIGRGAMAVVYRARERQLDRDVALKVLPFGMVSDAEGVERFQREARTAAQLEHPHIVPIYRVGRSGRVIFFTMKLLSAESLSARLARLGRLPVGEVRRVLSETAAALGYASARGIVHRDVKPDNILLDADGRCVVTDFGIARSKGDADLTAAGISIGTPRYMSPEQARGKDVDGRSDIYSLGVVGYHCLTGTVPFSGDDAVGILLDHVQTPVPRPVLATGDEWALYGVIERMLSKDPGQRFQTTHELLAALEEASAGIAPAPLSASSGLDIGVADSPYGALDSGPRPSAALDKALAAGIQLLREQQPRLKAGIAAGTRLARTHAPRLRSATSEVVSTVRSGAVQVSDKARRTRPRFWYAIAGVGVLAVGSWYGAHFALKHQSRCPAVAESRDEDLDAAMGRSSAGRRMSLLLDAIGSNQRGNLDVYYDVCGLEKGADFQTRINVVKNESGFRRLLGGVSPVTETFDESASGPATRRHRTLSFAEMPPGSYTLVVSVTDASGEKHTQDVEFQRGGK